MLKENALNIRNVIKMLKTAYNNKKKDPTDSQHYQISEFSLKMEKKSLFFLLFLNKIQMFEF